MKKKVEIRNTIREGKFSNYDVSQAVDATATATGATTGTIPATAKVVNALGVTGQVDYIIVLPAPVAGKKLLLLGNGYQYELQTSDPATIYLNGVKGAGVELAVAASQAVELLCVDSTHWIAINSGYGVPD